MGVTKKDVCGEWNGQYNDINGPGSWDDGALKLKVFEDNTFECDRQMNSGRDDEGWSTTFKGTWNLKGNQLVLSNKHDSMLSDFTVVVKGDKPKLMIRVRHDKPGGNQELDMELF